jgi:hypothetical protein
VRAECESSHTHEAEITKLATICESLCEDLCKCHPTDAGVLSYMQRCKTTAGDENAIAIPAIIVGSNSGNRVVANFQIQNSLFKVHLVNFPICHVNAWLT